MHRTYLPVQWNRDLLNATLTNGTGALLFPAPEDYIELWWSSGNKTSTSGSVTSCYLQVGSTTGLSTGNSPTSANYLHVLNQNWNSITKFALEVFMSVSSSSYTATAYLYDFNTSQQVSGSQVSTTSTSMTQLRSGQFVLTPGHKYGVVLSCNSSSGVANLTDASLIAFPS